MRNGNIFKTFGILTFIFELVILGLKIWLITENRGEAIIFDFRFIAENAIFFLLITAIGIGLMYRRKWAAFSFALANVAIATCLIVGAFSFPPSIPLGLLFGIVFLIPVVVTLEFKSNLHSGSKGML